MISSNTLQGIYDDTFDTGYYCDMCEYKVLVTEPHGEVTRHCNQEAHECPIVENAMEQDEEPYLADELNEVWEKHIHSISLG